ncbi:MAG: flavin reductase family protein [Chitinophagaceae bacterium]|jgi:flavin reductase (DIM6/NTAB) family NADH-FMN oxidoreductase RutF
MITKDASALSGLQLQNILQYVIAPRPICFASTINQEGEVNLSPFSYFNLFSVQPPICIFSPSRRLRDNTTKHTLDNLAEIGECVINIVTYDMVAQTSLASCEFAKGVNEFIKAGFTMLPSELVKPPRVAESPVQLECKINQVIPLGETGGAGNLVLAEIIRIHLSESILDEKGNVDQTALDLVARLGGNWYARINNDSLFQLEKPNEKIGIGFDQLPIDILKAEWLSNNEKAKLANLNNPPDKTTALTMLDAETRQLCSSVNNQNRNAIYTEIKHLLEKGESLKAWCLALQLS